MITDILIPLVARQVTPIVLKPRLKAIAEPDPTKAPIEPGVSVPLKGNKLDLIVDGKQFEDTLVTNINNARGTIWMQYYLFDLDKRGYAVQAALIGAIGRGVKVKIVADDRDEAAEFLRPRLSGTVAVLKALGADVKQAPFKNVAVNHRKLAIFDGHKAMVTGMNLTGNYLSGGVYHDTGVAVEGPTVRDIAAGFAQSYRQAGGGDLELPPRAMARQGAHSDASVSIVLHDAEGDRNIEREIVQRIDASKRVIRLENPFAISSEIQSAIVRARARGVQVQWIWGHQLTNTEAVMSVPSIARMIAAGVEVYAYPSPVHTKCYVFDDEHTIIGSSNLDGSATWVNSEASLQISSKTFAAEVLMRVFAVDLMKSIRMTEAPRDSSGSGWKDRAITAVGWIFGR